MVSRTKQGDLFVALPATDLSPKSQQDLMARAWFSLSKNPRTTVIEHKFKSDFVRVIPNQKYGMAQIWDYDLVLFLCSQVMEMLNKGLLDGNRRMGTPSLEFPPYTYFKWLGVEKISGDNYQRLRASLMRLHTTRIETNLHHEATDTSEFHTFYWIPEFQENKRSQEVESLSVTIPPWLWRSLVEKKFVLTLDEEYFSISGGLERWLYLWIRKSAGFENWQESFRSIYEKSAAAETFPSFTRRLRKIIAAQSIPHYELREQLVKRESLLILQRK